MRKRTNKLEPQEVTYTPENNIPIPENRGGGRQKSELRVAVEGLKAKQSIRVESINKARVVACAAGKTTGREFTVRSFPDGTARIWRVK